MDYYRIENLTVSEFLAMSLGELGSSLTEALVAVVEISKALQKAQGRLAYLRVNEHRCKLTGDAAGLSEAKESIFLEMSIIDNYKVRIRCIRDIRSGLQTMIRSVGPI